MCGVYSLNNLLDLDAINLNIIYKYLLMLLFFLFFKGYKSYLLICYFKYIFYYIFDLSMHDFLSIYSTIMIDN